MLAKSVELTICCVRELEKVLHQFCFLVFHEHTVHVVGKKSDPIPREYTCRLHSYSSLFKFYLIYVIDPYFLKCISWELFAEWDFKVLCIVFPCVKFIKYILKWLVKKIKLSVGKSIFFFLTTFCFKIKLLKRCSFLLFQWGGVGVFSL